MARMILVILIFTIITESIYSETWISVDNQSVRLRRSTRCASIGGGDQAAVCDCCLIKNTAVRHRSLESAISICVMDYGCRFLEKTPSANLAIAKENLKALSIIRIENLPNAPKLPKNGVLTGEDVFSILKVLHQENHLLLPSTMMEDANRLKIKPLSDNAKGYFSGQLFSIQYDAFYAGPLVANPNTFMPLYILKETKKGLSEIANLHRVFVSRLQSEKISTIDRIHGTAENSSKTIAQLAFDDLHFKLTSHGETRYFSLLQTAPGQSLHNHLKEFGKLARTSDLVGPDFLNAKERMKHIFYRVGFSMSELHQKYAQPKTRKKHTIKNTFTHGDLHSANIFYDDQTDLVTLIDNETFALSLKRPTSGVNDIVELYMLHTIHTVAHLVSKQLTTNREFGIDDELWHELWRELFDGYFAAFGTMSEDEFERLYDDFRKEFIEGFSHRKIFKSLRDFKDQRKLKRFGPSARRSHFKRHELVHVFKQTHATELRKYANGPNPHI